jgi:hypothetical protein
MILRWFVLALFSFLSLLIVRLSEFSLPVDVRRWHSGEWIA